MQVLSLFYCVALFLIWYLQDIQITGCVCVLQGWFWAKKHKVEGKEAFSL